MTPAERSRGIAEASAAIQTERARGPRKPIRVRRSWRGEYCQPCGECRACLQDKREYRELRTLRSEARRLKRLLAAGASAISDEVTAAGDDEVRIHPILRSHARVLARIQKALHGVPSRRPPPAKT